MTDSRRSPKRTPRITATRAAGPDHQVVTVVGGEPHYRREPCEQCPWRVDQVGTFPAEAFRHSADTAYDMAGNVFACHMAGTAKPQTCAGFLLRGAAHNMAVRLKCARGEIDPRQVKTSVELHRDYRTMAIANGVRPNDPRIQPCRSGYHD